ncbi:transporter substrate-binding domain-containing protein [Nitratidesulfovibrio sp. HK-II]|uniref:transporter substrate-binding domain-containing protein n=1 Tax=Nitratidesulfovibrio sp. HK-II TaxID=2009266 RepID=UPI000E2ED87E|nr:transporter substrate-binding domain-containing protein [Nitratidesulfovibrio sp. HK-II]GBO98180.1 amino acid ABC transporter [Nitratidesulfovibrio sp. HK-II]
MHTSTSPTRLHAPAVLRPVLTALLLLAALLATHAHAWAADASVRQKLSEESAIADVLERGVLRVGFSTFVPWAMQDKTGKFIGFEVDVATRLAEDLGVKVEFVPTKWSGIIPALLTGKFDVIIGGMSVKPDRNLKVNFTVPYDHAGMALMANRATAKGFATLEDFDKPEVTITARTGSTAAAAVKKRLPKATLRLFDDEAPAIQEVLAGRAHAMVSSAPLPAFEVLKNPDKLFLPMPGTFTSEPVGFAVRKGDVDTLNVFDNWIRLVEAEGWLKERKHYWFETNEWETRLK